MPCWKSRWLKCLVALFSALWIGVALAEPVALRDVSFSPVDDSYELKFDAEFELAAHLEQMLERGVTLTFRVEFEVYRDRWYWLDEKIARRSMNMRLIYHGLTRQYRVANGDVQQGFSSLRDALRRIGGIRHWVIADAGAMTVGQTYEARLRFFLDVSQLPKPLQLSAFASSEWDLSSETRAWRFVAGAPEGAGK